MLAVYAQRLQDEPVMLRCDNCTAIYCILQRGSRDDFRDYITKRVFELAKKWRFTIQISYIKSKENCSDKVLRIFKDFSIHTEWEISNYDFNKIKDWWIVKPEIDLFASDQNRKCDCSCLGNLVWTLYMLIVL